MEAERYPARVTALLTRFPQVRGGTKKGRFCIAKSSDGDITRCTQKATYTVRCVIMVYVEAAFIGAPRAQSTMPILAGQHGVVL